MTVEVEVDAGLCMGAQRCTYLAPQVFEVGGDGAARVLDATALTEEQVIEVARQCPNFAIRVTRNGELIVGDPPE